LILLPLLSWAVAGCGSDDGTQEPAGSLTASQYRQLEHLYRVQVTVEEMQEKGQYRAPLRKAVKACATVDRSDPLLAAVVAGCKETAQLGLSLTDMRCSDASRCSAMFRVTADRTDELLDTMRQAQRRVRMLLGANGCSEALAAPLKFLDAFETLSRALREMANAIKASDETLLRAATEKLEQSGERVEESTPSAATFLNRFRENCAE
jgi:hypothetical protein